MLQVSPASKLGIRFPRAWSSSHTTSVIMLAIIYCFFMMYGAFS